MLILLLHVGELARALLFCRPPEWEDLQSGPEEQRPEVQRLRCLKDCTHAHCAKLKQRDYCVTQSSMLLCSMRHP